MNLSKCDRDETLTVDGEDLSRCLEPCPGERLLLEPVGEELPSHAVVAVGRGQEPVAADKEVCRDPVAIRRETGTPVHLALGEECRRVDQAEEAVRQRKVACQGELGLRDGREHVLDMMLIFLFRHASVQSGGMRRVEDGMP